MDPITSHPHGTETAITVTTEIIRSEFPRRKGLKRPEHGINVEEAEEQEQQQQQQSNQEASWSKIGMITEPPSINQVDGNHGPCLSPVIHDKRYSNPLPGLGPQSGFEESPEWHEHHNPSSRPAEAEEPYLENDDTRLLPDQSWRNTKNFSTETIITAKSLSDRSSIDTAELGSRKLLCLRRPPSGRNLLKAGNIRLKHFIKPKNRSYFRMQPVPEECQITSGALQRLDLTASKKDVSRKLSKREMKRIADDEVGSSQKTVRNKQSSTSIVDLNQVEARQGVETHALITLSESWDEIFKSMGGFRTESTLNTDNLHDGHHSNPVGVGITKSELPAIPNTLGKHETEGSRKVPVKSPPLPGPRTSSMYAIVQGSPTRQSFEVVLAERPAQSTPTRRSKPESTNQEKLPTEPNRNWLGLEEKLKPRLREARSSDSFSKFGPSPDASQSTIALETIEAEMNNGRSLSPSAMTELAQPFSVHCTPPQPVTAPTEPPIGPLPRLPEEFDGADAASHASSSYNSSPKRPSRPVIPPLPHHRRDPSANSSSSKVTIRPLTAQRGHHRKPASVSSRNSRRTNSISSVQSVPPGGTSRAYTKQKLGSATSNNVAITGFNQYNLGNSQDLRSSSASEIGQDYDIVDTSGTIAMQSSSSPHDVLSSRSEHIKGLKLRDLAKEKARRTRCQHQCSDLDDAIVVESPSFADGDESASQTTHPRHLPSVSTRPPIVAQDMSSRSSREASRRENISRRPSYQSRRSSSNRASQRTVRSTMSQSQIMVLAETDPDTQTFRASTPTGSLRRTDSKKAESVMASNERKVRKRKSKTSIRSQVHANAISNGISGTKLNGEHTPPHSDPSSQSSDGDMEITGRSKSYRGLHHIAALAQEDRELVSTSSQRTEDKNYIKDHLRVKKLKNKSADLKLAVALLSRGLEKLTVCMEEDEDVARLRGYGLIEAEMEPIREVAKKYGREPHHEEWRGYDHASSRPEDKADAGKDTSFRRVKSARVNDARPLSLVSRYGSVRNSDG